MSSQTRAVKRVRIRVRVTRARVSGVSFSELYLEFHGGQLVEYVAHRVTDDVPRDLVVGLRRGLDRVPRHVVERDYVLEHAHGLVERTETIVRRIAAKGNRFS